MDAEDYGFLSAEELAGLDADRAEGLALLDDAPRGAIKLPPHVRTLRPGEPVELWLRNPHRYPELVREVQWTRFVYPASSLVMLRAHPLVTPRSILTTSVPFQVIVTHPSYSERWDSEADKAVERYPSWTALDDPEILLRLCRAYERKGWTRIVVGFLHKAGAVQNALQRNQQVLDFLHKTAEAFPHVRFHFTRSNTFRYMFGLNFAATDFDPAAGTEFGQIRLPNGRQIGGTGGLPNAAKKNLRWLHVLGYSVSDVTSSAMARTRFNLHSALWAAENYSSTDALVSTVTAKRDDPLGLMPARTLPRSTTHRTCDLLAMPAHDPDTQPQFVGADVGDELEPYNYVEPVTNAPLVPVKPRKPESFDKIVCDSCSLAPTCRYVRDGGICIVPSSDTHKLARLFSTRNADEVRQGLSAVLQLQATRYEDTSKHWGSDELDTLDDHEIANRSEHLLKMENSLMRGAEALIKILDPSQRPASMVPAINAQTINVYNPATLVSDVVKRLEAAGIDRSAIEPGMIIDAARDQGIIEA